MTTIDLDFVGPFTFTDGRDCLFLSPFTASSGVYLWTVRQKADNTHLIHYVGETASLGRRHKEHLIHILGLNYGIWEADKAQQGISELLWGGLWRDKTAHGPSMQLAAYQGIHEDVVRYLSVLNIFFAALNVDSQLRKHVEGCIGLNLRNRHPKDKTLYPDDNHVGRMREEKHGNLRISVSEPIRGLDALIPF